MSQTSNPLLALLSTLYLTEKQKAELCQAYGQRDERNSALNCCLQTRHFVSKSSCFALTYWDLWAVPIEMNREQWIL
jgi:hypothetical protein